MSKQPASEKLWAGRFSSDVANVVHALNASLPFDWRLVAHDLWQNQVYATQLYHIGVFNQAEHEQVQIALADLTTALKAGTFVFRLELEDVHMNIEAQLTEQIGDTGKKIHTGRSRNDQVATVFRLWLRDAIDMLSNELKHLIETTLTLAQQYRQQIIPGYTHLQRGQMVSLGHHYHAYGEMLTRDLQRLAQCRSHLNHCPLGSGALAGSSYPLDRQTLAHALGFDAATANSMDAVSDRDFIFEFLSTMTLLSLHLSRWAEDFILWSTSEFAWLRLPDAFATGSSMMPQKKNPDVAELVRSKTGRILGHLTGFATVLKGLPMTYNKDLQEDKEPVFDTVKTMHLLLRAWTPMLTAIEINPSKTAQALSGGHLLATDLADWLVQAKQVPFREAHHLVGRAVSVAEAQGIDLTQLPLSALQQLDPRFSADVVGILNPQTSLNRRNIIGGPAPERVLENIAQTNATLASIQLYTPQIPWAFDLKPPASWAY